jgi:hypothetical protein
MRIRADLVRELIYDFRDWQSIEATGRGGSGDGFDIRAFERAGALDIETEDGESGEDDLVPHPMEGNLWIALTTLRISAEEAVATVLLK